MDSKDWAILKCLFEEGSFNKAAEVLYISQPALTYRIQQLEKDLNISILWRNKSGVEFTPEGEYLVNYAKRMLIELQKTKDYVNNISKQSEGIIRLGVTSNYSHYRLPAILKGFLNKFPNVQVNVITGWSSEVYKLLQHEKVHIAIVTGDYHWGSEKLLLAEEHLALISKSQFEFGDLPHMPYISYRTSQDLTNHNKKKDPLIKQIIDTWWSEYFTTPMLTTMEMDKVETCIEMVSHNLGFGIVPSICLKPEYQLHTLPLSNQDGKVVYRKTSALYRDTDKEAPVIQAFIDYLNEKAPSSSI